MRTKQQKKTKYLVSQWLRKVFWQQPVPEFEVNTRTVEILYELAESSETRCREAELLIKDHEQKTEEYGSDGETLGQSFWIK
uniref:Uncharacterized protein n=1 Tax=Sinocyclocheilus anshuiensis TaxID=1608454 RepID=A0A671Q231_9TELE